MAIHIRNTAYHPIGHQKGWELLKSIHRIEMGLNSSLEKQVKFGHMDAIPGGRKQHEAKQRD